MAGNEVQSSGQTAQCDMAPVGVVQFNFCNGLPYWICYQEFSVVARNQIHFARRRVWENLKWGIACNFRKTRAICYQNISCCSSGAACAAGSCYGISGVGAWVNNGESRCGTGIPRVGVSARGRKSNGLACTNRTRCAGGDVDVWLRINTNADGCIACRTAWVLTSCRVNGGIAWGLDRLLMILFNEPNIREVIAFPKTGEGRDVLMQAPSPAPAKTLRELKIELKK